MKLRDWFRTRRRLAWERDNNADIARWVASAAQAYLDNHYGELDSISRRQLEGALNRFKSYGHKLHGHAVK